MGGLRFKLLAGLVLLITAGAGVAFTFGGRPYTVTARFLSAEGLVANNDVVVSGAQVGKVTSVSLGPDSDPVGGALVTMQIEGSFAPLHRGTRAQIRLKGLLGNPFIELTPAPASNDVIPSQGTIPIQDTAAPVDMDQVMDVFDKHTRDWLQTATREGGITFKDRGQAINTLLGQLPAITANTQDVTAHIAAQDQQLSALQVEFDRITYQMASQDQALRRDFSNGASLLDTLAAHSHSLQNELTFLYQGLGAVNAGLSGHEQDLNRLLLEMPAFENSLQSFSDTSAYALILVDPCMNDVIKTITEMADAQDYHQVGASGDGLGYFLRAYPNVIFNHNGEPPENGTPAANLGLIPCSGGGP